MNKLHLAILALALAVPLAAASGLRAAEQDIDTLRSECGKQLNLGESGCACIADTAAKELNDKQQALVAAMVTKDEGRSAQLRGEMNINEMTQAAGFMMRAPQLCAAR
ncbi:MAG TPA: hypothetical protein PK405_02995 [Hyphomicrobiales bacterium]|nr:hypothetical protein [Rhodobiaceae bacterium]HXK53629.1 hypothetical protein [Hyphomicrobiales bacterium]